ncbi:MAG: HEAT repeat domain-containing protein [Haloarculaceae archaeon]
MSAGNADDLMELDVEDASADDIAVGDLRAGLEADDNLVRTHAARLLGVLAPSDPTAIRPLVPVLLDRLDDERTVVVRESIAALGDLSNEDPGVLEGRLERPLEMLRHELPAMRWFAARAVAPVAAEHPEWFAPHLDPLLSAMEVDVTDPVAESDFAPAENRSMAKVEAQLKRESESRQYNARAIAARVFIGVVDEDPAAVVPHASRVVDLLEDASPFIERACTIAISELAETDPDSVSAAVDPLCDVLDREDETVVARAVTALGFVGDRDAVPDLRSLADDESRDEDLRDLAAETADYLETGA